MKVRCINDQNRWVRVDIEWWQFWIKRESRGPKENDVVTVENEFWWRGNLYYDFVEWPGESYLASEFVPIEEQYESVKFEEIKEKASVN